MEAPPGVGTDGGAVSLDLRPAPRVFSPSLASEFQIVVNGGSVEEAGFALSEGTPFGFVGLAWNPLGHPPNGIYAAPHFDIPFYTIT